MITFLNRKEVFTTFSMEEQAEVRELFSREKIDYRLKVISRSSPSPVGRGTRATMGSLGQDSQLDRQYLFFTASKDYDAAKALLSRRKEG